MLHQRTSLASATVIVLCTAAGCGSSSHVASAPSRSASPVARSPRPAQAGSPDLGSGHPLLPTRKNPRPNTLNQDNGSGQLVLDVCTTVTYRVSGGRILVDVDLPGEMELMVDPELRNGDAAYNGSVVADYTMPQGQRHHVISMPYQGPIDHVSVTASRHHSDMDSCWAYRAGHAG